MSNRRLAAVEGIRCETLETRVVLASTDVAAVGLSYHVDSQDDLFTLPPVYGSYALLGSVDESDTMSYRLRWNGVNGPLAPTGERDAAIRVREDGSFDYENPRWAGVTGEQGSWFLPEDGYTMGWWRALTTAYVASSRTPYVSHAEQQLIVPLAEASTPLEALRGPWRFSMVERDTATGDLDVFAGSLSISHRSLAMFDEARGESVLSTVINSGTGGSRFTTRAGQQFFMSADGSTLVFVDLAGGDGKISIGIAMRVDAAVQQEEVAGTYRFLSVASNLDPFVGGESTIQIRADGTYTVDSGGEWMPGADDGTWFVHQNREIVLRPDGGGSEQRFMLSDSGGTLLLTSMSQGPTLFAAGNRDVVAASAGDPALSLPSIGTTGEGLVFIDRAHTPWMVVDVAGASGGPEVNGELVTWFDARTGLARAAGATDRGLTVYRELSNGAWTYDALGESLGTGTVVRPEIAMTVGPGGSRNIIGINDEGELIRYVLAGGAGASWQEWNISENQLAWRGIATPDFIGSIAAIGTSWGGLNIAGIDANGDLVTVWTTLTARRWYVSNLSDNAGVGPLWSGLDGVSAGRNGIYYSAVDSAGKVTIVSWKPGDSAWSARTLSASPTMQQGEIAMVYDAVRNAVSIATLRLDSGALVLHTVPLVFAPPEPLWVTVSGFGVPMEQRVRDHIGVTLGPGGVFGVYGVNLDGETVRFTSSDPYATAWDFENLTEIT